MLGILSSVSNIAFTIFGRPVYWYGIIVTTAIVCAYLLYLFLANKRGIDIDFSLELFIWIVLLAVLCCRLFYVIPRKEYFPKDFGWSDFLRIFDISEGGLTIIGGIFGGALGVLFCCLRNKKYSFAKVADCVAIALLLGQIIGRWGNFFNQELFGIEIINPKLQFFPFAVYIDRLGGWYCGLFFYEGFINSIGLIAAILLSLKFKDKIKPMTMTLSYISWYAIVRGSLEFLKYEHKTFGGSNVGVVQVICFVVAPIAIVLTVLNQMGKISFETKWFAGVIAANQQRLAEAQIAQNEEKQSESQSDNQQELPDDSAVDSSNTTDNPDSPTATNTANTGDNQAHSSKEDCTTDHN